MPPRPRNHLPFLFLLLLPVLAFASQLSDELNTEKNNVAGYGKQINDLDKTLGEPLKAEKARLSATADLLKGAERNLGTKYNGWSQRVTGPGGYSAQMQAHQAKIAPFNARANDYNRRCSGTFKDINYVNACNREKAGLDAEANAFQNNYVRLKNLQQSLKNEKGTLDMMRTGLQQRRKELSDATLQWAQKVKSYNARRNDLVAAYNRSVARLRALSNQYGNCVNSMPANAKDEAIKHRCGNVQFDNVRQNLPALQNIRPPFSMTPIQ